MAKRAKSIFIAVLFGSLVSIGASSQAGDEPQGSARDLIEDICTTCHRSNMITRSSGYTREGWAELTSTMVDLSGNPVLRDEIVTYLAEHYAPNDKRASKLVPGDMELSFKEWQVPTLGQRSRDPVEAADGTIWWAGQSGNLIGSINPTSGEMTEYPLPAGAMPHSVTVGPDGDIWYTGNKNGTMGRLNPENGKIKVYPMPDSAARDPHTAVFDRRGILWFTLQQSNMVGRLDPETGAIRLVTMKTPRSRPYGIKVDADGALWVACNGSNCLVKVDPVTMDLTEVKLPTPATTVRRLDFAEDGIIWYVNSSQGRLGRYNPENGAIKEWPSPSGPKSHPYALVVVDGIVWYNESGKRPDALVRFDPKTEQFQSWAVPSGGIYAGIIRHMRPTRDGNLLIHQSSTNKIILVTPKATGGH